MPLKRKLSNQLILKAMRNRLIIICISKYKMKQYNDSNRVKTMLGKLNSSSVGQCLF